MTGRLPGVGGTQLRPRPGLYGLTPQRRAGVSVLRPSLMNSLVKSSSVGREHSGFPTPENTPAGRALSLDPPAWGWRLSAWSGSQAPRGQLSTGSSGPQTRLHLWCCAAWRRPSPLALRVFSYRARKSGWVGYCRCSSRPRHAWRGGCPRTSRAGAEGREPVHGAPRTGTAQAPFCLSRAVSLGPYFPGGENLRPGEGSSGAAGPGTLEL